jgi:ferredoxin
MKFAVDLHQCQNLGQCTVTSPDLFSFDDSGELSFRTAATDEYLSPALDGAAEASAAAAADMCPMQAISLQG